MSRASQPGVATGLRVLRRMGVALGPIALSAGTLTYFVVAYHWLRFAPAPPGWWAATLVLPPLLAEVAFTRVFEIPRRGMSRRTALGLGGRLLVLLFLAHFLVLSPIRTRGTIDPVIPLLGIVPYVVRLAWFASPIPSALLGLACAAAYVRWTVRERRARLVTTLFLPGAATVVLSMLLYELPGASFRGRSTGRPSFVSLVWAGAHRDYHYPREVVVTPDERHAVATFGTTLEWDSSDPPPNELDLPDYTPKHVRRNTVVIDLATGADRPFAMHHTRRIYGDGDDRVFVVPWQGPLLEFGMDGSVRKHPLPEQSGGQPIDEVNFTGYFSRLGRVYMLNNKNPVLMVWNTRIDELERVVPLAGWSGVAMGDNLVALARNPTLKRLYVLVVAGRHDIVEIDEETLQPTRVADLPNTGADIQVSPDGTSLFVSSLVTEEIWRLDADSLVVRASIRAPLLCRRLALSPDGSRLLAASYVTGELDVFDARSGDKRDAFYVAPRLEGMHIAGGGVYLLSADGLYRVPLDHLVRENGGSPE